LVIFYYYIHTHPAIIVPEMARMAQIRDSHKASKKDANQVVDFSAEWHAVRWRGCLKCPSR